MKLKMLYLDIETAPMLAYIWRLYNNNYIGTKQIKAPGYTLCWAAKWHGSSDIMYMDIREGRDKMVKGIYTLMEQADALIHFNGTKFDVPVLQENFLLEGLDPPHKYTHIDLLKTVRKQFNFPSNKLDYVCQALGIGAKVQHKGLELWDGCMHGNEKDWEIMKRYNMHDVRLLPKLFKRIRPWIKGLPNAGVMVNAEKPTCICGSTNIKKDGVQHNLTLSYQRYRCLDCRTPLQGSQRLEARGEGVLK